MYEHKGDIMKCGNLELKLVLNHAVKGDPPE